MALMTGPLDQESLYSASFLSVSGKLKATATQTILLSRLLPQFFGDTIPTDDPDWELCNEYREILNVLLAERITHNCISNLEVRIDAFLRYFVSRHASVRITSKLCYLIHYSRFNKMLGPPRRY